MEFSQRTTLTDADWQQWAGRNIAIRDGGIELAYKSEPDRSDGATTGVAYRQFDAERTAVQWHRLVIDHQEPAAGTQLRVAYVASDEPTPLEESLAAICGLSKSVLQAAEIETIWEFLARKPSELAELSDNSPETIRKAQDRTLSKAVAAIDDQWQPASTTEDILLAAAKGRYLTVRVELVGTQQASPRVESVRASWPRQSYLQYLPEIYQDTDGVLEQFLAVFGTLFTDIEREIQTVTELIDPRATPAEALPWLAAWLGVETPAEWPLPAIRTRLAAAPEHHPTRGTRDGLRNMLALYLAHIEPAEPLDSARLVPSEQTPVGMDVDLEEVSHGLWILENADLESIGPAATDAYSRPFSESESVVVYAGPFEQQSHKRAVEKIIDRQTPAHITHRLVEIGTEWRLGHNGFLGETSRLADRSFKLGGTRLGSTAHLQATRVDAAADD